MPIESQVLTVFESRLLGSGANNSAVMSASVKDFRKWKGVRFFLSITAKAGTSPTLNIKIQAQNPLVPANFHDIVGAAFAEKTGEGSDFLTLYPGLTASANLIVSEVLGCPFRVVATIGGTAAPTFTFSLAAVLLH